MASSFMATSNPSIDPLEVELPAVTKFKIGICQLSVSSNKDRNIRNARNSIKLAADQGAKLVLLPEMWNCPFSTDYFENFSEDLEGECPSITMLSKAAASNKITVIGGSIPERENQRLYNTCFVFGSNGQLLAKHRKIHLFDFEGDPCFKESDSFTAGDDLTLVQTNVGCIGVGICHDIRFAELAMIYRAKGAQLICYPGAFNISTGEMLWELVQRGRAADNQLFVATCSPSRDSVGSYPIWGHSTVVGPHGEIIATCGSEENTLIAKIDLSSIQHQREETPLEQQKRGDIYLLKETSLQ